MRSSPAHWATCLLVAALPAAATTLAFDGRFDDSSNTALVGSDLGAPQFGTPADVANNVALFHFSLPGAQTVRFDSDGFASGGADPYYTLFSGADGGATVLQSNYVQAFSTGGDFDDSWLLPAGDYTLSLGVFANLSLAENTGSGTLADGFTRLGVESLLGNAGYALTISFDGGGTVPEPGPFALLALLPLVLGAMRRND